MFMHKSKKGFTIVELVIVIAVIAILAAVLIPTFSNLVKKANQSADIQAARQMNTVLAAEGAVKAPNIFGVYEALGANGMTAKDYRPLATDHYFFWDDEANCIVYTDKNYQVLFPTDFAKEGNWVSLNATIPTVKPATYKADATTVSVTSAEELAYVVEQFKDDKHTASSLEIDLGGKTLDMNGASIALSDGTLSTGALAITTPVTFTNGTIKNVSAIDPTYEGKGGSGHDGIYFTGGLFGAITTTVTLDSVTIENVYVKNTHVSGVGLLAASVEPGGELIIQGTTTIRNCTVIGHRNTGALVGYANNKITISGTINMENVTVQTVGGNSGMLIGFAAGGATKAGQFTDTSTINLTNCSFGIYECDQNTGTYNGTDTANVGKSLGLTNDGKLASWSTKADGTEEYKARDYTPNAYVNNNALTFNKVVVK